MLLNASKLGIGSRIEDGEIIFYRVESGVEVIVGAREVAQSRIHKSNLVVTPAYLVS